MASWKEERDRLVAQTLAFVQHVASAHPTAASKLGLSSSVTTEGAHVAPVSPPADAIVVVPEAVAVPSEDAQPLSIETSSAPNDIVADLPERPTLYAPVSERSDITQRVAAFKARQLTLNREREDYYDRVQARIRSSLRNDNGSGRL